MTFVFLHGAFGAPRDWDAVCARLTSDHRALELPATTTWEDTVAELARTIAPGVILVGYSLGARLALAVAARRPDVAGLVLESGSDGHLTDDERVARRALDDARLRAMHDDPAAFFASFYRAPVFAADRLMSDEELSRKRADGRALGPLSVSEMPSHRAALEALSMPVLFVHGTLDRKYAVLAREMAAATRHATVLAVAGAGHNVHRHDPAGFALQIEAFANASVQERTRDVA